MRITIGSLLGLTLAKVMDWPFGVFFAVYPILLLGLVPVLNKGIALQFLGSSAASIIVVQVLLVVGDVSPPAATITFFIVSATCFWIMVRKRHFLFGAVTMVTVSILAHLASHPIVSKADMFAAQAVASFSALVIAIVMHGAMPERRAIQLTGGPGSPWLARHQVLLGSICATASYVAFQVIDLGDSLSAQAATVLVLFPMTLSGGRIAVWTRFMGTLIGSASALAIQLALYTHIAHLLLIATPYAAAMLLFSTLHVREAAGPAVGFSAATAIAVLIGQLSPQSDLYGTALYRFASVSIASLLMLLCMFATHALLNVFPATRYSMASGDQPGARSATS